MASSVAAIAFLLALGAASAAIHDVIPSPETQFYWGLNPHDDVAAVTGDTVVFRTALGFHDVAMVSTKAEFDACDVSKATQLVDLMGTVKKNNSGTSKIDGYFYEYSWNATTAGTYYFVCTVGGGKHCKTGQKTTVTVTAGNGGETHKVVGSAIPFWTVGVGYNDMNITLGDSIRFVSDNQGMHDVALLNASMCGASNGYSCCGDGSIEDAELMELYSEADFMNKTEFIWKPEADGYYEVVCSVGGGVHCAFGQRFSVTVLSDAKDDTTNHSGAVAYYANSLLSAVLFSMLLSLLAF